MEEDTSGAKLSDSAARKSASTHHFMHSTIPVEAMEPSNLLVGYLERNNEGEAVIKVMPLDAEYLDRYHTPVALYQGRITITEMVTDLAAACLAVPVDR